MGKYPVKVHGWKAVELSHHTRQQLGELLEIVLTEHANDRDGSGLYVENGQPTIHMLDVKGRRKLDAVSWALFHKDKRDQREANGSTH